MRTIPPSGSAARTAEAETLGELLSRRFSCRGFSRQLVGRDTIEAILGLAQLTPSGCNAQPWQVTVTSGAATDRFRAALTTHARDNPPAPDLPFPREYREPYKQRRREAAWNLYDSVGVARGDRAGSARQSMLNFSFFGAPHVAIVTTDEALGPYGAVDCGLYVGTFLLAAQAFGVAAVPQGALAEHSGFIRSYLGLSDRRLVVCGISFGFEDPDHPANRFRTERAAIHEVATFLDE
jgi:nitroreductase